MALSRDGSRMLAVGWPQDPDDTTAHPLVLFDLAQGTRRIRRSRSEGPAERERLGSDARARGLM